MDPVLRASRVSRKFLQERVEIACAFAPRIRWLVKRLKDCPPPRCFHVKYLLFALLFFSYFSLVSLSILYRAGTYESLIARFSCKAISLSHRSRHNSESNGSKISFSSDVKYLNKFQRLPFVGIPREVKGQISYKNQITGKSNGDVPIIVISLILRIPCHNVIEYHTTFS